MKEIDIIDGLLKDKTEWRNETGKRKSLHIREVTQNKNEIIF